MAGAIPVIVCGRSPAIMQTVKAALRPEYEVTIPTLRKVIQTVFSTEAGVTEIPTLLSGRTPLENPANLGTKNYSSPPLAVIMGGGYDDAAFKEIHHAAKDFKVPWLRPDVQKYPLPPGPPDPELYEPIIAERCKAALKQLGIGTDQGKDSQEGVFYF